MREWNAERRRGRFGWSVLAGEKQPRRPPDSEKPKTSGFTMQYVTPTGLAEAQGDFGTILVFCGLIAGGLTVWGLAIWKFVELWSAL